MTRLNWLAAGATAAAFVMSVYSVARVDGSANPVTVIRQRFRHTWLQYSDPSLPFPTVGGERFDVSEVCTAGNANPEKPPFNTDRRTRNSFDVDGYFVSTPQSTLTFSQRGGRIMSFFDIRRGQHALYSNDNAVYYDPGPQTFPLDWLVLWGGVFLTGPFTEHSLYFDKDWHVRRDGRAVEMSITDDQPRDRFPVWGKLMQVQPAFTAEFGDAPTHATYTIRGEIVDGHSVLNASFRADYPTALASTALWACTSANPVSAGWHPGLASVQTELVLPAETTVVQIPYSTGGWLEALAAKVRAAPGRVPFHGQRYGVGGAPIGYLNKWKADTIIHVAAKVYMLNDYSSGACLLDYSAEAPYLKVWNWGAPKFVSRNGAPADGNTVIMHDALTTESPRVGFGTTDQHFGGVYAQTIELWRSPINPTFKKDDGSPAGVPVKAGTIGWTTYLKMVDCPEQHASDREKQAHMQAQLELLQREVGAR